MQFQYISSDSRSKVRSALCTLFLSLRHVMHELFFSTFSWGLLFLLLLNHHLLREKRQSVFCRFLWWSHANLLLEKTGKFCTYTFPKTEFLSWTHLSDEDGWRKCRMMVAVTYPPYLPLFSCEWGIADSPQLPLFSPLRILLFQLSPKKSIKQWARTHAFSPVYFFIAVSLVQFAMRVRKSVWTGPDYGVFFAESNGEVEHTGWVDGWWIDRAIMHTAWPLVAFLLHYKYYTRAYTFSKKIIKYYGLHAYNNKFTFAHKHYKWIFPVVSLPFFREFINPVKYLITCK